jgi:serine/threonine protein kinase
MSSARDSDLIITTQVTPGVNNSSQPLFKGKLDDYIIGKELGKGSYAVVKQVLHKPSGMKLAIKFYDKFRLMDPLRKNAVKREIQIMKQLDHPNVVKLYEVIDTTKQVNFDIYII